MLSKKAVGWRDITGYDFAYQVSKYGSVLFNNGHEHVVIKRFLGPDGTDHVLLKKNGIDVVVSVRKLIATTFKKSEVKVDIKKIARVCHEVNRIYCETLGDFSQVPWESATKSQVNSTINSIDYYINNPLANPIDLYGSWMEEKKKQGWKYGIVEDTEKKEHPCMVYYEELPEEERIKDKLFISVLRAFIH